MIPRPVVFVNIGYKILTIILLCPVPANSVVYKKPQQADNHRHAENYGGKLVPLNAERASAHGRGYN